MEIRRDPSEIPFKKRERKEKAVSFGFPHSPQPVFVPVPSLTRLPEISRSRSCKGVYQQKGEKMGKLIAGVQMYTLRDYCKTVKETAETLKKVRGLGYEVVQVSGMAEPKDMKEMKRMLDDNGLYACSTHTGYQSIIEEMDRVIEEHAMLGCEAIVCPGLPGELHSGEGYVKVAGEFSRVMGKIRKAGLVLGYHNHAIELRRYDGRAGLEILMDSCKNLHAEIDTYWIQFGGGNPAEWIEKFSGRCSQLHFKDMGMIEHKQVMPPIGEGNLNWKTIVSASRKAGVRYCLVEMDEPVMDGFQSLKISLENMLSWGIETAR